MLINDLEGKDTFVELGACMASKKLNKKDKKLYVVGDYEKTSFMQNHNSIIHCKTLLEVFDQENVGYIGFTFPRFE
jgi:hypothetical protein